MRGFSVPIHRAGFRNVPVLVIVSELRLVAPQAQHNVERLARYYNHDIVWQDSNPPCVTYGEPDVWHEITMALRPSGHFYKMNPAAPPAQRVQQHDTMLKVWYDGRFFNSFDPDAPLFRKGQPNAAECAAQHPHDFHPAYDHCHTGLGLFNDSRDRAAQLRVWRLFLRPKVGAGALRSPGVTRSFLTAITTIANAARFRPPAARRRDVRAVLAPP